MSKIWQFPRSNRVAALGLSGSGTDQFSNEPINNLAREVIQNSLDAKYGNGPVVVEFHSFSTPIEHFPGSVSFGDYVIKLYNQYKTNPKADEKEKRFVENVVKALNAKAIPWLRISDFNTTGLYGASDPADQNTPWFAFIKGAGKNQKDAYSGGSRGLGKNAIFVNSIVRTMFVSTYAHNPDNGQEEYYNTGIAKLLSYVLRDENPANPDWTQGIGFYVKESDEYNSANEGILDGIDPEYNRFNHGYGTDIYLPFFRLDDKWDDLIIYETIRSFIPAIMNNELVVRINFDDTSVVWEISKNSLPTFLSGKGNKSINECKALYSVMTSNQTKIIEYNNKPGFEMTFYMLQDNRDGLNEVYEYRCPTKMLIRHEKVDCPVGYTGILIIKGKDICTRLRSIEDATHKNWAVSRYKDSGFEKSQVEEAKRKLENFVEEECGKFGSESSEDKIYFDVAGWNAEEDVLNLAVDETKEYGLPTEEIVCNTKGDTTNNPKRKPYKKKGNVIDKDGDAETDLLDTGSPGEGEEEFSHPDGHNKGKGGEYHPGNEHENYNPNEGDNLVIGRRRIATLNARMPAINPEEGMFDLVFKPKKTGIEIEIEILKSGIDGDGEETYIYSAVLESTGQKLEVSHNKIKMDKIEKGVEYRIHLKLDENANYIWEVNLDGKE